MLKSCPYCGRIHAKKYRCPQTPKPRYYGSKKKPHDFHSTNKWTEMSRAIRGRDCYMCVYCLKHDHVITRDGIEVHHIVPVREDEDRRLDSTNLISLCREHHEAAECGDIGREELFGMVMEEERNDLTAGRL